MAFATIFISGPMSGLPDFNRPAFMSEAARLRALGYFVFNPGENTAPPSGEWADWMRLSIRQLTVAQALVALPGWIDSQGARLEQVVAQELGLPVFLAGEVTERAAEWDLEKTVIYRVHPV